MFTIYMGAKQDFNLLLLFVCLDAKCIIFLNVVQQIILLCLQNESVDTLQISKRWKVQVLSHWLL